MIIGIEAQRIFRTKKFGIDRVAIALIKHLQKLDTKNEYFIFVKLGPDSNIISETSNFKIIVSPKMVYPLWEQFYLPKIAKKYHCDILHCTSGTAPLYCSIPIILTLHDIIFFQKRISNLLFDNSGFYNKFGNIYRRIITPFTVKKSKVIITVSYSEKEQIIHTFPNLREEKIKVIYNGVNTNFSKEDNLSNTNKHRLKLPKKFLLFFGGKDSRKNLTNVVKAFSILNKHVNDHLKIIILHQKKNDILPILKDIKDIDLLEKIILIDYVSDDQLKILYKKSLLFLYVSKREGFGIPIIEAMKCKTPVIASNCSSMIEISEGAAHLVDPNNPEDISNGILKVVTYEKYRLSLINKGIIRSNVFIWKNTAQKTLISYFLLKNKITSSKDKHI